ncbi:fluoride efflux transporter CrcB [Aciduricibacillus chroicocephali]|uniref:Fluoride-specific ion channel FluC n=1 Tax=Aciduricibacillus chroicocephali TaxID=3054939 RepID=A0ABY9KTG2_9BACI|nr:fluoride efflux transporter CrcB [Bacillaceae bacterium 44XB]
MQYIIVAIGGFFGALARYSIGVIETNNYLFPVSTLTVNLIGCLFLGWFSTYVAGKSPHPRLVLLIGTGFTGSFTTFSSFSVETWELIQGGHVLIGLMNIGVSIIAGLLLVLIGMHLAKAMLKQSASS